MDEGQLTKVDDRSLVLDVLEVYESIRCSQEKLYDRGDIEERRLTFPAFDGNKETTDMAYAKFLRNK